MSFSTLLFAIKKVNLLKFFPNKRFILNFIKGPLRYFKLSATFNPKGHFVLKDVLF